VAESERFGTRYKNIPAPQAWFSPDLPIGTVYDFATRYYELHHLWQADMATWEKTRQTAPYDHDVIRAHRHKKYGEILTAQQVEDSFARTSAYNVWAMGEIAEKSKSDPSKYIPAFKKIAALDGDAYVDLSEYLREQHREEEAVEAYRSALEKAHDQVKVACQCHWLVDYEFDHGRKDEALKIATKAAEAHSAAGYEIMGALMERMERWSEAEKYYWIDAQRYKDYGPLTTFYMERREKDPRAAGWLNQIFDEIYPDGVEKATVADSAPLPKMVSC
jgi:tetratricopeptide (TPR) repeat protein